MGISASLTGETNAYFSDQGAVKGTIQAGIWETETEPLEEPEEPEKEPGCSKNGKHGDWDCSSLEFPGEVGVEGQDIFAIIKNGGSDMKTNGRYEVYYIEKGNPKDGEAVTEILTFEPLTEGQERKLTFTPTKTGIYRFKAYQHEDHPKGNGNGNGNSDGALWSDSISFEVKTIKQVENKDSVIDESLEKSTTNNETLEEPNNQEVVESDQLEEQEASVEGELPETKNEPVQNNEDVEKTQEEVNEENNEKNDQQLQEKQATDIIEESIESVGGE